MKPNIRTLNISYSFNTSNFINIILNLIFKHSPKQIIFYPNADFINHLIVLLNFNFNMYLNYFIIPLATLFNNLKFLYSFDFNIYLNNFIKLHSVAQSNSFIEYTHINTKKIFVNHIQNPTLLLNFYPMVFINLPYYSFRDTFLDSNTPIYKNDKQPIRKHIANIRTKFNTPTSDQYIEVSDIGNKNNQILVIFLNIRSLNHNFDSLYQLINDIQVKPALIGLSETWITKNRKFLYTLPGYDFISNPSPTDHRGVGFLVSNKYAHIIRNDLQLDIEDCEDIWIELELPHNRKITFGVVYRHPRPKFNNFMNRFCSLLGNLSKTRFLIGGDFNINLFKDNNNTTEYIAKILSFGCQQTVTCATRYSSDFKTESLIDHIYSNLKENLIKTNILTTEITDHLPIVVNLGETSVKKKITQKIMIQDMKHFDQSKFAEDLYAKLQILEYDPPENINDYWNAFKQIFQKTIEHHAPKRILTKRETKLKQKPWITKEILKSIRHKNQLFKRIIRSKHKLRIREFRHYRNKLNKNIETSKRNYYKELIRKSSNSSRNLWKTINNLTNPKRKELHIEKLQDSDNNIHQEKDRISNILNNYFVSVAENLMRDRVQDRDRIWGDNVNLETVRRVQQSMFLRPITPVFIENFINNMKPRKSNRSNAPKTIFLKAAAKVISPVLANIFNRCIESGIYPEELKLAEIIPIYKSGSKSAPKNYRPISLLSPFTKILENYLYNELINFLNKHNVLYHLQYGFREGSSTELAITQLIDEITNTKEKV